MTDTSLIGPWIRRFLVEYLVSERNLSRNTQRSYRDTLRLLLPFLACQTRKQIDQLAVTNLSSEIVKRFLQDLEGTRGCGVKTRNQRLAAIHSLAHFVGQQSPEHLEWCGEIRRVPFKKSSHVQITYLEKSEIDALLAAPDCSTALGRRDYAVLLFLYNTGARADEAAQLRIADLELTNLSNRQQSLVKISGKGNKQRRCPLWPLTVKELNFQVSGRSAGEHVFLNRLGQPLSRFGIHTLVERCVTQASKSVPSLAKKRISPHTIRHTTATHLLRAGVDINTIRAWLGHVSLATTNVYAEVDMQMKAKAIASCELKQTRTKKRWREDPGLMAFLRAL
jgi:integrase/recombinase XerD